MKVLHLGHIITDNGVKLCCYPKSFPHEAVPSRGWGGRGVGARGLAGKGRPGWGCSGHEGGSMSAQSPVKTTARPSRGFILKEGDAAGSSCESTAGVKGPRPGVALEPAEL